MKENHSAEAVKIFTFTPVWLVSACVLALAGRHLPILAFERGGNGGQIL
jgi:hypothetical protein